MEWTCDYERCKHKEVLFLNAKHDWIEIFLTYSDGSVGIELNREHALELAHAILEAMDEA